MVLGLQALMVHAGVVPGAAMVDTATLQHVASQFKDTLGLLQMVRNAWDAEDPAVIAGFDMNRGASVQVRLGGLSSQTCCLDSFSITAVAREL